MTISTTSNKVVGLGNGVNTNWPFQFLIPAAANLFVYYTDAVGNITAIPAGQYSVAGLNNPNGGSVTYPLVGTPIAAATSLTIYRSVPYVQLTDVTNQGDFYPEVYEAALDYLCMEVQQLAEIAGRSLTLALTTTGVSTTLPSPQAGFAIGWDTPATRLVNLAAIGTIAIPVPVAYGGTGQVTAPAAIAALGGLPVAGGAMTGDITMTAPAALEEGRSSVAMNATTMDLFALANVIDGTGGAVTITAIVNAPQAGARRTLYPTAGSIITNGATFAVDGAANQTAAAGDKWEFEAITVNTFKVHITKKDGTAVAVAVASGNFFANQYYPTF